MNRCARTREIVITDYIDGQLSQAEKARIEGHLQECSGCRAFAAQAEKELSLPFAGLKPQMPPEQVWTAIVERIALEREEVLKPAFLRLSPVFVSFILAILISSAIFFNQYLANIRQQEQLNYFSSIFTTSGTAPEANNSFGTLIEEFFL